jgi:hypothetical protein
LPMEKFLFLNFGEGTELFQKALSFGKEGKVGFMIASYTSEKMKNGLLVAFRPN